MSVIFLMHTSVTQSIQCLIFLMYAAAIRRINYKGHESTTQSAVYDSDIPVTLKQGQGNQTWFDLLDPKQVHNYARFERPPFKQCLPKSQHESLCQIRKHINYLPQICANVKKKFF